MIKRILMEELEVLDELINSSSSKSTSDDSVQIKDHIEQALESLDKDSSFRLDDILVKYLVKAPFAELSSRLTIMKEPINHRLLLDSDCNAYMIHSGNVFDLTFEGQNYLSYSAPNDLILFVYDKKAEEQLFLSNREKISEQVLSKLQIVHSKRCYDSFFNILMSGFKELYQIDLCKVHPRSIEQIACLTHNFFPPINREQNFSNDIMILLENRGMYVELRPHSIFNLMKEVRRNNSTKLFVKPLSKNAYEKMNDFISSLNQSISKLYE